MKTQGIKKIELSDLKVIPDETIGDTLNALIDSVEALEKRDESELEGLFKKIVFADLIRYEKRLEALERRAGKIEELLLVNEPMPKTIQPVSLPSLREKLKDILSIYKKGHGNEELNNEWAVDAIMALIENK